MLQNEYERLKKMVEDHLYEYLPIEQTESKTVLDAMKYSLSAGGKRIRPILLLAACKFCGKDEAHALPYACAIEYIHTYSLIHDDLPAMDNDSLRRGKPTNHIVFGEAAAILAGDGLLNAAFEVMLKDMQSTGPDDNFKSIKNKISAALSIANGSGYKGMIGGQMADIEAEVSSKHTIDKLEFIHRNKTGALITAAVKAGALIGGAEGQIMKDLVSYGNNLGLAFQISDDLLDIYGDVNVMGKSAGSDIKLNKLTYPALIGIEESKKLLIETHIKATEAIRKYSEKAELLLWIANQLSKRSY